MHLYWSLVECWHSQIPDRAYSNCTAAVRYIVTITLSPAPSFIFTKPVPGVEDQSLPAKYISYRLYTKYHFDIIVIHIDVTSI